MADQREGAKIVPSHEPFLTAEDLGSDDNDIIFVQHDPSLETQDVANALAARFGHHPGKALCCLTEISTENAVYPVAFIQGGVQISRPVDHYFFASHM
jgi:hypothetical protein